MRTITANFRSMLSHPSVKWIVSFCLFCLSALGVAQAQTNNVYAVGQNAGCDPRMKVVFHQAGGTTTEIFVSAQDVSASDADFNQVLYNPGYGTLPSGVSFYGWTTTENYSEIQINTSKTIDEVRTDVKDNFAAGTTKDYYALLFKHHTVTYIDEVGASLGSDVLYYRPDASPNLSYTVNMPYTAYDPNKNFEGWNVSAGENNVNNGSYEEPIINETSITVSGDVKLKVNAPEGQWLVFDENGKGATYNAPQFVKSGERTHKPCEDEEMKRLGYTFVGWYLNPEGTGSPYSFNETLS